MKLNYHQCLPWKIKSCVVFLGQNYFFLNFMVYTRYSYMGRQDHMLQSWHTSFKSSPRLALTNLLTHSTLINLFCPSFFFSRCLHNKIYQCNFRWSSQPCASSTCVAGRASCYATRWPIVGRSGQLPSTAGCWRRLGPQNGCRLYLLETS